MTKYLEIENKNHNATHVKVRLYYDLGGYDYLSYTPKQRGYYLSVQPVERASRDGYTTESFTAFTGTKFCILPVTRKSKKAAAEAERIAAEKEKILIDYVCRENGLVLAEVVNNV